MMKNIQCENGEKSKKLKPTLRQRLIHGLFLLLFVALVAGPVIGVSLALGLSWWVVALVVFLVFGFFGLSMFIWHQIGRKLMGDDWPRFW
jgi:fatty acid desaturase